MTEQASGLAQAGVHELIRMMIEQNSLRDKQMVDVLSKVNINHPVGMLPDLKQNITSFDGESIECAIAEEWLNSINITAKLHFWPEEYKIEVARANLTGAAKNWFLANQTELNEWMKFEKRFKEIFMVEISISEKWKRMKSRNQEQGESVFAYVHDMVKLCNGLGLTPSETKKMLCVGLQSK